MEQWELGYLGWTLAGGLEQNAVATAGRDFGSLLFNEAWAEKLRPPL